MHVGKALVGAFVEQLGVRAVYTEIGSVMLRWTSSVVGINQNGASTDTAGTATRVVGSRLPQQ